MSFYLPYSGGIVRRHTEEFLVFAIRVAAISLLLACVAYSQAVYVPNYTTSNVSGYLTDSSTGGLTPIPGMPVRTGTSPVQALIHPSGQIPLCPR